MINKKYVLCKKHLFPKTVKNQKYCKNPKKQNLCKKIFPELKK